MIPTFHGSQSSREGRQEVVWIAVIILTSGRVSTLEYILRGAES